MAIKRNPRRTTRTRQPNMKIRMRQPSKWTRHKKLTLLNTLGNLSPNTKRTLQPTKFSTKMAKVLFDDEVRSTSVYTMMRSMRERYFILKARLEAGDPTAANQIARFSFYDECQRAFDPDYTASTAISSPATTTSSSPSQQRSNRPMVIPNGDLDDDDDVSLMSTPIPSRESSPAPTALYSFSSSAPQRSNHLTMQIPNDDLNHDNDPDDDTGSSDPRDDARGLCVDKQPNNQSNYQDTTPCPSKALNNENRKTNQDPRSRDKEIQLQLKMMEHEKYMAKMRIRELELILEITKEQENASSLTNTIHPSHHATLRPSIATGVRPFYM